MRRNQQFSVSCRQSDWEAIRERAKDAGMTISRFIVACALEDEDDMRLALSETDQRDLLNRVNRTLLILEDLMAPLPGSEVTAMEALSFLYSTARDFQAQRQSREQQQEPGS